MSPLPSFARSTPCGAAALVFLAEVLGACGGTTSPDSASSGKAGAGSAEFYAMTNVPTVGSTAGASYQRSVTFTAVGHNGCSGTTWATTVGPCSLNPCLAPPPSDGGTEALLNAGTVTIDGAQMPPLTMNPASDGVYAADVVKGRLAWTGGGEPITFQWAHLPGDPSSAGGSATLDTPPYIALTSGSAFATAPTTLARDRDLTVAWTSDTAPTSADQVAVDLESGSIQVVCIFPVSAGTGVIPAAALALVPAGAGSYNIHSKQGKTDKSVGGSQWSFGFNVDAQARTSSGLAKGSVTFD